MQPYYYQPRVQSRNAKRTPWWLSILLVCLSLPFVIVLWAAISVTFHLPPQTGQGWAKVPVMIIETILWGFFMGFNHSDQAVYRYLPWSLLVLYGAFAFLMFIIP